MRDVAEQAGVSVTTVSHIINQTRPVSNTLRQRVVAAMRDLGYQPNALARSLRRKETHTIGMIVPDSANPFFAEVTRGIEDASFEQDYNVILCNSDDDLAKQLLYINVLTEKQVDGILVVAAGKATPEDHLAILQERQMPIVVVDRDIPGVVADAVLTDHTKGAWMAVRHLVDTGHCRIGCITGRPDLSPSPERLCGYKQALQDENIVEDQKLIIHGDFQFESGYQAAQQLLAMEEPPTAIFACNDLMAIGAVRAALEQGRQIPSDLSIVGFDDIHLASYTNPPLTTVAQPKYEMGRLAATFLLERLRDRTLPFRRHLLDATLQIRQSTTVTNRENNLFD